MIERPVYIEREGGRGSRLLGNGDMANKKNISNDSCNYQVGFRKFQNYCRACGQLPGALYLEPINKIRLLIEVGAHELIGKEAVLFLHI